MNKISSDKIKVIAIVGPTASGKTAYSIDLAKKLNGEIISADSRLVYKGFDIGTAKPTKSEMQGIPHHMIDIVEPDFSYTAGLYKKEAAKLLYEINSRGNIPIIVGGTGLYTDILLRGYNLPDSKPNPDFRKSVENLSNEELYDLLLEKDPESAKNIYTNDRKKIIRALEIIDSTGKKLDLTRDYGDSEFDVQWIGRNFDRETLYKRIDRRVDIMIENGLIDETKFLLKKHGKIYNLVNTIGYREILQYIDGKLTLEESSELLKKNTRNYAKRQLTWFRRNENIEWNTFPQKLKK